MNGFFIVAGAAFSVVVLHRLLFGQEQDKKSAGIFVVAMIVAVAVLGHYRGETDFMAKFFGYVTIFAALAGFYFLVRLGIVAAKGLDKKPYARKFGMALATVLVSLCVIGVTYTPKKSATPVESELGIEERRAAEQKSVIEEKPVVEEKPVEPQPIAEELAERERLSEEQRRAEEQRLAEEKRTAELERQRQQAEERQRREAILAAAREAELAATQKAVDDFNNHFLDKLIVLGIDKMGTPKSVVNESVGVVTTYPLDQTGDLDFVEVAGDGRLKFVRVEIHNLNRVSLATAVVIYNVAAQVFVTPSETNQIFRTLRLDETFFDDLQKHRSTTVGGYTFEKRFVGKMLTLSIAMQ